MCVIHMYLCLSSSLLLLSCCLKSRTSSFCRLLATETSCLAVRRSCTLELKCPSTERWGRGGGGEGEGETGKGGRGEGERGEGEGRERGRGREGGERSEGKGELREGRGGGRRERGLRKE